MSTTDCATSDSVAHQFRLDAPRIAFRADDHPLDSRRVEVLWAYVTKWATKHGHDAATIRHWCTQTALAPVYTDAVRALQAHDSPHEYSHHLIDNGQQTITLASTGVLHLQKPFRVVGEHHPHKALRVIRHVHLRVSVAVGCTTVRWDPVTWNTDGEEVLVAEGPPSSRTWWWATVAGLVVAWGALQGR